MAETDRKLLDGNPRSLPKQLKAKSRRRREGLAHMAAAYPLRNDVLPSLEIVYLALDELKPAKRKLRKIAPDHVREVAASISALGFCAPVLIGKDNVSLDGEIRIEAARILGLDCVPCIRITHLNENEQRVLHLAVNRLGEKGEWGLDELK